MPFHSRFPVAAAFAAAILLGVSCSDEPPSSSGRDATGSENTAAADARSRVGADDSEALIERGRAIVQQAFGVLSTNLARAIQQGGVTNAIQFCSVQALPLTASVSRTNQVRITRISHKPRNPDNAADESERKFIDQYQEALRIGTGLHPRLENSPTGTGMKLFYAPIVLQNPICLNCHGNPETELTPDTRALLARLYPNDSATGFKLGDVRGLWRVEFVDE